MPDKSPLEAPTANPANDPFNDDVNMDRIWSDTDMIDAWSSGTSSSKRSYSSMDVDPLAGYSPMGSLSPSSTHKTGPKALMRELHGVRDYLTARLAPFFSTPAAVFFADAIRPGLNCLPQHRMAACNKEMMALREVEATIEWMIGYEAQMGNKEKADAFAEKFEEVRELRLGFLAGRINSIPGENSQLDGLLASSQQLNSNPLTADLQPLSGNGTPERPSPRGPMLLPPSSDATLPVSRAKCVPLPPSPPPPPIQRERGRSASPLLESERDYRDRSPLGAVRSEHHRRRLERESERLDGDPEHITEFETEMERVTGEITTRQQEQEVYDADAELSEEERQKFKEAQLQWEQEEPEYEGKQQLLEEEDYWELQEEAEDELRMQHLAAYRQQKREGLIPLSLSDSKESSPEPIDFMGFVGVGEVPEPTHEVNPTPPVQYRRATEEEDEIDWSSDDAATVEASSSKKTSDGGLNFTGFGGDTAEPTIFPQSPRVEELREGDAPMAEDKWTHIPGLQIQPAQMRKADNTPTTPSRLSHTEWFEQILQQSASEGPRTEDRRDRY